MSSFLVNCARCKNLIARNTICPNCNHAGDGQGDHVATDSGACQEEFARRRKIHNRNSSLSMVMKMAAGFLSLVTVVLWAMFIYQGSIIAFIGIGMLTVMSAIFGWVVIKSDNYYPIDLNCPNCQQRLDHLNISYETCPNCNSRLT